MEVEHNVSNLQSNTYDQDVSVRCSLLPAVCYMKNNLFSNPTKNLCQWRKMHKKGTEEYKLYVPSQKGCNNSSYKTSVEKNKSYVREYI